MPAGVEQLHASYIEQYRYSHSYVYTPKEPMYVYYSCLCPAVATRGFTTENTAVRVARIRRQTFYLQRSCRWSATYARPQVMPAMKYRKTTSTRKVLYLALWCVLNSACALSWCVLNSVCSFCFQYLRSFCPSVSHKAVVVFRQIPCQVKLNKGGDVQRTRARIGA